MTLGFKQNLIEDNEKRYGKEIRKKYGDDTVDKSNEKLKNMTQEDCDEAALAEQLQQRYPVISRPQDPFHSQIAITGRVAHLNFSRGLNQTQPLDQGQHNRLQAPSTWKISGGNDGYTPMAGLLPVSSISRFLLLVYSLNYVVCNKFSLFPCLPWHFLTPSTYAIIF